MIIYYTDSFNGGHNESRSLLKRAFAVYTGDDSEASRLEGAILTGEKGKPYIEGFDHFSVSHSGRIWAVLISECECGLDVQLVKKCDAAGISGRLFAAEDADAVRTPAAAGSAEQANDEFFRLWCRREALVKAIGGTVYDTSIPSVLPGRLTLDSDVYTLSDLKWPGRAGAHAALCLKGEHPLEVMARIDITHL